MKSRQFSSLYELLCSFSSTIRAVSTVMPTSASEHPPSTFTGLLGKEVKRPYRDVQYPILIIQSNKT
jgi:hypothetical protein